MTTTVYRYLAEDRTGKAIKGSLAAVSIAAVRQQLRARALTPLDIRSQQTGSGLFHLELSSKTSLPLTVWARISSALADLLSAGVPLSDALSLIQRREPNCTAQKMLERVEQLVRSGSGLSEAFAKDPIMPPKLFDAYLRAGETSGTLDKNLTRLADTFTASVKFQKTLVGELVYPALLTVLVFVTIVFLSVFVLPEFEYVFSTADASPPFITKLVLDVGAVVRSGWQIPVVVALCLVLVARIFKSAFQDLTEQLALKTPGVSAFLLTVETGNFMRTLGTLLIAGVPLAPAFPIAISSIRLPRLRTRFTQAADLVRNGATLTNALEQKCPLPDTQLALIETGERTGRLGPVALKAAELCEEEVKSKLSAITQLAGPLLTIVMGLLIASVVGAVMIGVLSLNDTVR